MSRRPADSSAYLSAGFLVAWIACASSSFAIGATADAATDAPRPGIAIGVAPFTPASLDAFPDVALLLATELSSVSGSRVVGPAELLLGGVDAGQRAAAGAADVRLWASLNRVDAVVLGRAERGTNGGMNVDVQLRSGHSGAAVADYRLEPESDPEVTGAVEKLATLILADLAAVEPASVLPPVSAPDASRAESNDTEATGAAGDDDRLSLMPGAKNDDPISINSDELEVVPLDGGRRLVFSRNVIVVQGDIRLLADRLEAIYPAGASRPEKLVADGHVTVAQGERTASCDQATYERALQTIVCRGKAEVVQGCDRVRGREIEFDLEHERVRVTGAASVLIRPDDDVACTSGAKVDSSRDPASGGSGVLGLDDTGVLN